MSGATVISSDDRRLAVTCAAAWIAGWHRLRRQPGASSGSGPNTWTRSRSGRACRPSGAWSPRSAPRGWNTRACAPVRRSAHCRASSARAFSVTCASSRARLCASGARCAMSGGAPGGDSYRNLELLRWPRSHATCRAAMPRAAQPCHVQRHRDEQGAGRNPAGPRRQQRADEPQQAQKAQQHGQLEQAEQVRSERSERVRHGGGG